MQRIWDCVGKEIVEGNTILLFNNDTNKWSLELVVSHNDELYSSFSKYLGSIETLLVGISPSHIVRMFNKTKKDFFGSDDFRINELYPVDANKIASLMMDARNKYNGWDTTEIEYRLFFETYKGKYDSQILDDILEEELKISVRIASQKVS